MNKDSSHRPPIGLATAVFLVVGNMIGAGVFTTSGFSLAAIGNRGLVVFAWAVGGCIAMCGAIAYGALARRITQSGGEYLFLSRTMHPVVGFVAGWVSLLSGFTGAIAAAAATFELYAFSQFDKPEWLRDGLLGAVAILVFGAVHAISVRRGLLAQNLVVVVKLGLIACLVVFAMAMLPFDRWKGIDVPDARRGFELGVFAQSLVYISFCYCGFNAAVYVTSEVSNPKRNVPRALIIGTALVAVTYVALNSVFLFVAQPELIAGQQPIATITADLLGGRWLASLVQVTICLALLSSISAMILAGPRVYAQMANDRVFPRWFAFRLEQDGRQAPVASIVLQTLLAAIVVNFTKLPDLLMYLGFALSLSSAAAVCCVFLVPAKQKSAGKWNQVPPWVLVAAATYVGASVGLALIAGWSQPYQFLAAVGTIVSGVLAYHVFRWTSNRNS